VKLALESQNSGVQLPRKPSDNPIHRYFDNHQVFPVIESALRQLSHELPDDPFLFLANIIHQCDRQMSRAQLTLDVYTYSIFIPERMPESDDAFDLAEIENKTSTDADELFSVYLTNLASSVRRGAT
jgi:hypothetical protein